MADDPELDAYLTFSDGHAGNRAFSSIVGETHDVFEKTWSSMQIKSYRFGFDLEEDATEETGSKDGKTNPHAPKLRPLQITKPVDMGSPQLFKALTAAARFDWVCLWQKKSGGDKGKSGVYFWKIEMRKVTVTSLEWSANAGDSSPEETLTLTYEEITAEYLPQKRTGEIDTSKEATLTVDYTPDAAWVPDKGDKGKGNGKGNGSADFDDFDPVRMKPFVDKLVKELRKRGVVK